MHTLETSSHILQLFPVPREPYYALVDRARPTDYSIVPLTANTVLAAQPTSATTTTSGTSVDDSDIHLVLDGLPIGDVPATSPAALADFMLYWKEAISSLSVNSSKAGITPQSQVTLESPQSQAAPPAEAMKTSLIRNIEPLKTTFLEDRKLKIRAISWNIHAEPLTKADIHSLLGLPEPFDLYILAIQESDQLGPKNLYANQTTLSATQEYLVQTLGGPKKYQIVAANQLLGIMLLVVAATPLIPHLSAFSQNTTGTGIFGIWGNKGAAVVSFYVGQDLAVGLEGTHISILNCHLAHGEGIQGIERRRWELSEIQKKLNINGLIGKRAPMLIFSGSHDKEEKESNPKETKAETAEESKENPKEEEEKKDDSTKEKKEEDNDSIIVKGDEDSIIAKDNDSISDEDLESLPPVPIAAPMIDSLPEPEPESTPSVTIVLGDLNYRVALDPVVVQDLVEQEDYETILTHDRLIVEHESKRLLPRFSEAPIKFPPTYKYVVGTDDFDDTKQPASATASGIKRARAPSYTDRIFFASEHTSEPCTATKYESLMEYTMSDHKPVAANLEVVVKTVDPEKRRVAVSKILKESDDRENLSKPTVTVTPREVAVDDALVLRPAEATVALKYQPNEKAPNKVLHWQISLAPDAPPGDAYGAEAAFVSGAVSASTPVSIWPLKGVLPPGATQYIKFGCTLPIAKGTSTVSRVAVLNIIDTQDIFVPVEFRALPTSLGTSLDVLSRLPKGARSGTATMSTDDAGANMPKEIWSCVDYLWQNVDLLFAEPHKKLMWEDALANAEPSLQLQVQEWLDLGEDFDTVVLAAANAIVKPGMPLTSQSNLGLYSVAAQFLLLLENLDGGVVPVEYYPLVLHGREGALQALERVPRVNVNVLLYLASFLKLLLDKEQQANEARAQKKVVVNAAPDATSTTPPTVANTASLSAPVTETPAAAVAQETDKKKEPQTRPKSRSVSERFASSLGDFGHNALGAVTAVGTAVGNGVVEAGHGVVDAGKGVGTAVTSGLSNLKLPLTSTAGASSGVGEVSDATAEIKLVDNSDKEEPVRIDAGRARAMLSFFEEYVIARPAGLKDTKAAKNARVDFLAELVGV